MSVGKINVAILIMVLFLVGACETDKAQKLFTQLDSEQSGIHFSNNLSESDTLNYFLYKNLYNGGGVAIGDVDNDGLQDIYLTGNMVANRLYHNQGDLQFSDITDIAGVAGDDRWVTGATMADVNQDGWLDIYVSVAGISNSTKNMLYLNDANENGPPTFTESAEQYGIADTGNSTQAVFFDYDLDGDLDLYVTNYPVVDIKTGVLNHREYMNRVYPGVSDHLYRYDNGKFHDVTVTSNIMSYGLSLGVSAGDFNNDGWPDLYVSNDFATPDYFFFNNGDGTFSEKLKEVTNHTAFFGMGIDAADINNDGLLDFLQVDMTPEDNYRSKANMGSMNTEAFWAMVDNEMHYQYMQNAFQLNVGNSQDGLPRFSEISQLANVAFTDWSWAPLIADFDNDGWKDLFITNGSRREMNNKDFFREMDKDKDQKEHFLKWVNKMPEEKIANYALRNRDGVDFYHIAEKWGVDFKGWSTGASYADLDNDGDLDLVINNIDDISIVYKNNSNSISDGHYLRIIAEGPDKNKFGLGTKVTIFQSGQQQYQELTLTRGFQSSVEPILHFGLGNQNNVEKIVVLWPDGKQQVLNNVEANQVLTVRYDDATTIAQKNRPTTTKKHFEDITEATGLNHRHYENYFDDFKYQVLLPHKMSQFGPALAVGDINNDGLDDFYVGGAKGFKGEIYMQNEQGGFEKMYTQIFEKDKVHEDVDALFFDADGDKNLDLYVVSGGNEEKNGDTFYQDRLYKNNGDGSFSKMANALPEIFESGSVVKAVDFDKDGDLDLFVGSRLLPRSYPLPGKSYLLKNESTIGHINFTDVTNAQAKTLSEIGMVTDAVWADIDLDGHSDLILTGEWMPVTIFINRQGYFTDETETYGIKNQTGWWSSVSARDFDGDGDIDLIAGNLGENYKYKASKKEPFSIYVNDYDKNGKMDIVLSYMQNGKEYPLRGKQCSSEQIPVISLKFKDYNSFAKASLADVYSTQSLLESRHYEATNFATSYFENKGEIFEIRPFEQMVQLSSVNTIYPTDVNKDGKLDIVLAGNLYGSEIETPRNDASYGLYLAGDGNGNFKAQMPFESGLLIKGEVRKILGIKLNGNREGIVVAVNNGMLSILEVRDVLSQ